jgi:hypothetical protein
MTDPKKKLRQVLFSIYPVGYRIKCKDIDKNTMNKKLFIEVLTELRKIEDRRDFLISEIGMDVTVFEDAFFLVIENLMKMHFNKAQLALIQTYLYQLVADTEWDGTITIEVGKKEQTYNFKTPTDVWNVINKLE